MRVPLGSAIVFKVIAIAIPLAAIAGILGIVSGLGVRQAMAEGEQGTFTPQFQTCKQEMRHDADGHTRYEDKCSWTGTFEGAATSEGSVHIDNSLGTHRGDARPAPVDAVRGSDGTVYLDRTSSWLGRVVTGGAFLAASAICGAVLLVQLRKRRRQEADQPIVYMP